MSDIPHEYLKEMIAKSRIGLSARAIIVNPTRDRFLVEKNLGSKDQFMNFIGGRLEFGETLEACLEREISEETDARITRNDYLFVVENFIKLEGETAHGMGHYFEVELDREEVKSYLDGVELIWLPINELAQADLRPHVARDAIVYGTYKSVRRLISKAEIP